MFRGDDDDRPNRLTGLCDAAPAGEAGACGYRGATGTTAAGLDLFFTVPLCAFVVRGGQTKRCIQIADDQRRDAKACDFNQPAVIWIVLDVLSDVSNAFVCDLK